MKIFRHHFPFKFIVFVTVVLIAIFVVENINHRFWLNDFKVYYSGAKAFISGSPVYGVLFALGSGYYKYSPFTLLLVLPFCLFPFNIACVFQFFFLSVSIIGLIIVSWYIINKYLFDNRIKNSNLILSIGFIAVINHLVRELHLGNINVVLLMMLCFSLLFILQKRLVLAGMMLALVIITKPFFILILLPVLLRKNYKVIFAFGVSVLLFLISPAAVIGFSKNKDLHKEWIQTLLDHNSSFPGNNTIESLVKFYINPGIPYAFQYYVLIFVCIGYVFYFFINRAAEKKRTNSDQKKTGDLIIEWFTLIAFIPSLVKTDTQHFLLTFPLLLILLCYLLSSKNYLLITFFAGVLLMYGGNSSDLVGMSYSIRMDEAGLLGISNLIILSWMLFVYFKFIRLAIQNK